MAARALLRSRLANDPAFTLSLAVFLAAGIAALDYSTDYELRFGVLYLPAVFIAAWGAGRAAGIGIGLTTAALWIATLFVKYPYAKASVHFLEGGLHLIMYAAFALLIARLKEALQLADERFASALDSLDAAAWVVDPRGGALLYANQNFMRAFSPAVDLGRRFGLPVGSELPEGEGFDVDSGRWYYVLARAMRWLDGRLVRLHVATDITEAKLAQQLARQQQEQLERTTRLIAVGEMASTLAHELNQPLGAIANYNSGAIRMLKAWSAAPDAERRDAPPPDSAKLLELMEKCGAQALRAGEVVRRIREFVRMKPPELRVEDPCALVAEAVSAVEGETHALEVDIRVEAPQGLPRVQADRTMIGKVMLNLARNGVEAMAATPREGRQLVVRAQAREGEVEFQFADRGCGVPAEMEKRLFYPFVSSKADGMGLGLAICRSIVEYHRGELWFTRNPEGGSTFHFTVPRAA